MSDTPAKAREDVKPTRFQEWLDRRYPMFRSDRIEFLISESKKGDIVPFLMGSQTVYLVNHPDLIRDVLVVHGTKFAKGQAMGLARSVLGNGLLTSDGDYHLRQRRMLQPAFHRQKIADYGRVMVEYARAFTDEWKEDDVRDIATEMMSVTLQIVGRTLFGTDLADKTSDIGHALTTTLELFNLLAFPFSELINKMPPEQAEQLKTARETLDNVIYRIIAARHESNSDTGDLLSMMLMARDEDDGEGMTDEQVRDETMTLFLAGHETTANALTWTWYLLSEHPEKRALLEAEIDEVLEGRLPEIDDLPKLKYLECIFAEAMRLYPPAWALLRNAKEDHELGGVHLPAGSMVICSTYVMQRDPRFWERADEFIPERWQQLSIREEGQKCTYFPFGGGMRRCMGEQFAWMEGPLIIATLAQRWRLDRIAEQEVGLQAMITLRPKYGMRMRLNAR